MTPAARIARLEREIALLRAFFDAARREDHAIALVQECMMDASELPKQLRKKKKHEFEALVDQWNSAERDKEDALLALVTFDGEEEK